MHFVGIKCEVCNELENTSDPIDNLPYGWIALVQKAPILSFSRHKDLHFCSWKCLYSWTRERESAENTVESGSAV